MAIQTLLIANRGEIACRIVGTVREVRKRCIVGCLIAVALFGCAVTPDKTKLSETKVEEVKQKLIVAPSSEKPTVLIPREYLRKYSSLTLKEKAYVDTVFKANIGRLVGVYRRTATEHPDAKFTGRVTFLIVTNIDGIIIEIKPLEKNLENELFISRLEHRISRFIFPQFNNTGSKVFIYPISFYGSD